MESSKVAVSGDQGRKRRKVKRRKQTAIRLKLQPLQLQPEPEAKAGEHDLKPEKSESPFLENVRNVFGFRHSEGKSLQPESLSESEQASSSAKSSSAVLSPEAESVLARVPDVIGEEPLGDELAIDEGSEIGADEIRGLLDAVAFEEQDVKDTLEEGFEFLSEYFGSDHWKLTPRQVRMLGRPTAQLLNSVWAKLKDKLPEILARWCESTPGATAFVMACGLVVVPKGLKQWKISRERKAIPSDRPKEAGAPAFVSPPAAQPQPQRRPPQPAGDFSLAPAASGIVGQ